LKVLLFMRREAERLEITKKENRKTNATS